jgi:hypothetical protein
VTGYNNSLLHGEAVAIGPFGFPSFSDMGFVRPTMPSGYSISRKLACRFSRRQWLTRSRNLGLYGGQKGSRRQVNLDLARGIGECFIAKNVRSDACADLWRRFLG